MKRLVIGLFIVLAAPLSFSSAAETESLSLNETERDYSALISPPATKSSAAFVEAQARPDDALGLSDATPTPTASDRAERIHGKSAPQTFMRLNLNEQEVLVQAIAGGINGAQISVCW